jgi:hypothetical protein
MEAEPFSEMLVFNSELTWLITQEHYMATSLHIFEHNYLIYKTELVMLS